MIIRLTELEKAMRPQFIFDRTSERKMQTNEEYEGNKELARMIFVGLADMYGFQSSDITDYLDIGYDSYRYKLSNFKDYYKESVARVDSGQSLRNFDESLRKFYVKTQLCINSLSSYTKRNVYVKLAEYL